MKVVCISDTHGLHRRMADRPDGDVLITHGPPHGILDEAPMPNPDTKDRHVGCEMLLDRVLQIRPQLHVFGHIHEGYGVLSTECHSLQTKTTFVNAATCDAAYRPVNAPIVVGVEARPQAEPIWLEDPKSAFSWDWRP